MSLVSGDPRNTCLERGVKAKGVKVILYKEADRTLMNLTCFIIDDIRTGFHNRIKIKYEIPSYISPTVCLSDACY